MPDSYIETLIEKSPIANRNQKSKSGIFVPRFLVYPAIKIANRQSKSQIRNLKAVFLPLHSFSAQQIANR